MTKIAVYRRILALSFFLWMPALLTGQVNFHEDFSDNSAGWMLGTEWQIGPAVASPPNPNNGSFGDPGEDADGVAGGGVAGMNIGGNISQQVHAAYWLTSPAFDTTGQPSITLEFMRWLNADYTPYMQSTVEVWDGAAWQTIWSTGGFPGVRDSGWTAQSFDLSSYANSALQVRFGLSVGSGGAWPSSGWNIDNVKITADQTFFDDFSSFVNGWTLGTEWQIGAATASSGQSSEGGFADPASDADGVVGGGVAGTVLGGNQSTAIHAPYWITSPVVDTTGFTSPTLTFDRWLNTDLPFFVRNYIDCWDGSAWVRIWDSNVDPGPTLPIQENTWTPVLYDLTPYSNSALQVRIGHEVMTSGAYIVSGWNIDNFRIGNLVAPEAEFMADVLSGPEDLTVNFTTLTTGNIANVLWDFGDGTTSTQLNPTHVYTEPGIYTVSLTVTANGAVTTEAKTDYITVDPVFELEISGTNVGPDYAIELLVTDGTPGAPYFTAVSFAQGAYPNGWFYGIDISLGDLFQQYALAIPPFRGTFDAAGDAPYTLTIPSVIGPLGLPLTAVTVELDPATGFIVGATAPVSVTL